MLKDHVWTSSAELRLEIRQSGDEGRDVEHFRTRAAAVAAMEPGDPAREEIAENLLRELAALSEAEESRRREPSELTGIRAASPGTKEDGLSGIALPSGRRLLDRIHGAWLGRCAGCLLGQPVETWRRERLVGLLRDTGNYPPRRYISSAIPEGIRGRYGISDDGTAYGSSAAGWVNNIRRMPEDDDINYMLIALKTLELRGRGFTPDDVGERWLSDLPVLHLFTAERIAYRNLMNGLSPPLSASHRNPCREWIGAQIRADLYGYVNPGRPEAATGMAYWDASVSHTKNGIYGSMFVAAMLAAASVTEDIPSIVRCGLAWIPGESRYARAVRTVMEWRNEGIGAEDAIERLHRQWDESDPHHWCHAVSNGMVVCIGLLWGEGDLGSSIGTAVLASFDKDCNGATVGSVVGKARGAAAHPRRWTRPQPESLETGVSGFLRPRISSLAERTAALCAAPGAGG